MSVKRKTKKNKAKARKYRSRLSSAEISMLAVLAGATVCFLAFISPHIALVTSGFSIMTFLVYLSQREQEIEKQAAGFQMKLVKKAQDKMAREVQVMGRELAQSKGAIETIRRSMTHLAVDFRSYEAALKAKDVQAEKVAEPEVIEVIMVDKDDFHSKVEEPVAEEPILLENKIEEAVEAAVMDVEVNQPKPTPVTDITDVVQEAPKPADRDASFARQEQAVSMKKPKVIKDLQKSRAVRRPAPLKAANDEAPLSVSATRNLMRHAVKQKEIEVFVQPIMTLPQRKTRFYEMYARLPRGNGRFVSASKFMNLAREQGMDGQIDTLLLGECLKIVKASAHIEKATPFFINISKAALSNRTYMSTLLGFVKANRALAGRLIFEIQHTDYRSLNTGAMQVLQGLGKVGCGLAFSGCMDLSFNVPKLLREKIRYIKIEGKALENLSVTDSAVADLIKDKRKLEGNGIAVIAEKIESERDLRALMDLDLMYGQGFLFGRPALRSNYAKKKAA